MKKINALIILILLAAGLAGCYKQVPGAKTTPPVRGTAGPVETVNPLATSPIPNPAETLAPVTNPTTAPPPPALAGSEEAIMILNPAPGSRVISPVRIEGLADPAFNGRLILRIVGEGGRQLALQPLALVAGTLTRSAFGVEVPIDIKEERNIFIQVYAISASDNGVVHLTAAGVTFTPAGPAQVTTRAPYAEQVTVQQPQAGAAVSAGVAHVVGYGLASFEQTLQVQVLDAAGNVVGAASVTVQAPDAGQPGPFTVDVPYQVAAAGPGRIIIRDISPAFGGDVHLASVEVTLQP